MEVVVTGPGPVSRVVSVLGELGVDARVSAGVRWWLEPVFPRPGTRAERVARRVLADYVVSRFGWRLPPTYEVITKEAFHPGRFRGVVDGEVMRAMWEVWESTRLRMVHAGGPGVLVVVLPGRCAGAPEDVVIAGVSVEGGIILWWEDVERYCEVEGVEPGYVVLHELAHEVLPTEYQSRRVDEGGVLEDWAIARVLEGDGPDPCPVGPPDP